MKLQLAAFVRLPQPLQKLSAEHATENADWQEEAWTTGNPARPIGGEPSAGDDAMDMRVMQQILSPGVQHGQKADLGPQMFRIGGNLP